MGQQAARTVLRHLRKLVAETGISRRLDQQLLQQFLCQRDESAFAELIRRHGPMVVDAARCVLHNLHDAEDVFQATFLVLARKAGSIRKQNSLASWLYGVAYRLAMKARSSGAKRQAREQRTVPQIQSSAMDEMTWRELRLVLHEELHRLPEKHRTPLLLCYFEGKTQDEAARHLGWNKWTLKDRLEQARDLLRTRLTRRGLIPSAALFATLLSHDAASAVPTALLDSTLNAAMTIATGQVITGAISAQSARLVELAITGMPFTKAKLALALLLIFGMIAAGASLVAYQTISDNRSEERKESQSNEVARVEPAATVRQQDLPRTDPYGDPLPDGALARLGTVRLRHGDSTLCGAFTRDGKTVLTSDALGTIVYWDVATGRSLRRLQASRGSIHALAVSPEGKTLAAGGSGEITLWNVATGRQTGQGPVSNKVNKEAVMALVFSPDGKTLAVRLSPDDKTQGRTAYLWDVGTASVVHRLEGHRGNLMSIAFSPDGKLVASGAWEDPFVRLWDPATGKEVRQIKATQRDVLSVAFSPDGKELATAGNGDPVRFWDPATGKRLREAEAHLVRSAVHLCYYPDGKKLAGIAGQRMVVWDTDTGKLLFRGEGDPLNTDCLIVAPDGKTVAASAEFGGPHTIELWYAATGKLRHHFQGHCEGVRALGFTADGRSLCSAASTVLIWDPLTAKERRRIGGAYNALTLSADGRFLVAPALEAAAAPLPAPPDDAVGFWEVATGAEVRRVKGHTNWINSVSMSADGKTLAWSSFEGKKAIRICSAESGTERRVITHKQDGPGQVVLSPDGRTVAAGGFGDGAVRLWDSATGKERRLVVTRPHLPVYAVAFSPDGRVLATGGEFACLWDPATGKLLRSFDSPREWIRALAFSPDGRTLATVGSERTARLWEVATGRERALFIGHQGEMRAVAFSPDGARLATGSEDTTILVWDVASRRPAGPAPEIRLSSREIDVLWTDLGGQDAARAHRAVWALAAAPDLTVPFLKDCLRPASPPDPVRMARLIAELDNDRFSVREKAVDELAKMEDLAEPTLRMTLAGRPSLEVRRRVEQILARMETTPHFLQKLRAIETLEHIATSEAARLLEALTRGVSEARLTQEAKASLERLEKKATKKP